MNQYNKYSTSYLGVEFIGLHPNLYVFMPEWDKWMINNGKFWEEDRDGSIKKAIIKFIDTIMLPQIDIEIAECQERLDNAGEDDDTKPDIKTLASLHKSRNVLSNGAYIIPAIENVLKSVLSKKPDIFVDDIFTLNLNTGLYDLKEGVFKPRDNHTYHLFVLKVDYDAGATCPKWEEMMKILQPSEGIRNYVQKFLGYCLSGSTIEEIGDFWIGNGGNGKSTVLRIVNELLNGYSKVIGPEILFENLQKADVNKAEFEGRRLCISDENNRTAKISENILKEVINGEGSRITARKFFNHPYDFRNTSKLIISGNHYPNISSTDDGLNRRLHIIPWDVKVAMVPYLTHNEDGTPRYIINELRVEFPGILNWLIKGYNLYVKEGLKLPVEIVENQEMIKSFNSPLCDFVDAHILYYGEPDTPEQLLNILNGYFEPRSNLWSKYQLFCKNNDIEPSYKSNRLFYPELLAYIKGLKGNKGVRYIRRADGWGYTNILYTDIKLYGKKEENKEVKKEECKNVS